MDLKNFLYKKQFDYKINFIYFLFKKTNFIIFLIILYLFFFVDNKNLIEKTALILLSVYLVFTYLNTKNNISNYIDSGKDNLLIKFIIKVKEYVYKK